MSLCDLCKSIPFEDLPPFPDLGYGASMGLKYVRHLLPGRNTSLDDASMVRHHANLEDLRRAAAEGCELCLLIQGEADAMLAELDGLEGDRKRQFDGPPSFDMWLTKSPESSQGFWVLSGYSSGSGRHSIAPIAAFGFAVTEDHALADTFRGRPVKQYHGVETMQRLRRWDADCEQNHECCREAGPMPSHLIDVQSFKSEEAVKLVELDAKTRQKYTALTYASESGIVGYWENNRLPEDGHIIVTNLPKTFQEAILVTRTLGVQYLWIDSLCIPGDVREWARDAEQAGSVYTNAYLTISATGSENVTNGLLFPRPLRNYIQIPYKVTENITRNILVSVLPLDKRAISSRDVEMREEPLSRGVWSFQERVLSSKIVHFASDQMYFECLSHFVSEDGLRERFRYHTTAEKLADGADHFDDRLGKNIPLSRWFSILRHYSERQSRTTSDKLLALSNVARAYQRMLDDEYVVGLWNNHLFESLCWQSRQSQPAEKGVPSWSWASFDGMISGGLKWPKHPIATVINIELSLLDDAKPFGSVTAASIELEAPLIPLTLFERQGYMFLRANDEDEDGFYAAFDAFNGESAASAEILRDTELFALILAGTRQEDCSDEGCNIGSCSGLVVTPIDAVGDRVKRLGCIFPRLRNFKPDELSNSRKTVKLV